MILNICTFLLQNEVKSHVFFASINWDELVEKRIPPPFNPSVVNVFFNIVSNNLLYFSASTNQWHGIKHLRTIKKLNVYCSKAAFLFFFFSLQESQYDISNFDPEFTDETVPNSVCICKDNSIVNASVMEADDAFLGFSYAPPSDDSFL